METIKFKYLRIFVLFLMCSGVGTLVRAQSSGSAVELNGDAVEYSIDGMRVIAKGDVVITFQEATLTCDMVEFHRDTKIAYANGHVRLVTTQGEISGDALTYNFETMKGDFNSAHVISQPFYGHGKHVKKIEENQIVMEDAYITTCDHDKPHYSFKSKKVDVYPGDKMVARNIRVALGKLPVMFIPRFTQNLKDKKPRVILTPGYDSDWGAFLLSQWRFYLGENVKGTVHLDYRERKDFASGIDLDYKTKHWGEGILRTYYMNERAITSSRFYQERPTPTVERERYKAEWRHKWQIDNKTNAIMQYYRLSDSDVLNDYFESEHDADSSPDSFFLMTRALLKGTLSVRTDFRVNRFEGALERLPEVRYTLANQPLGKTGLYFKDTTTYSNLINKSAAPSEVRQKTMRLDTDNELSYPMKLGFIEAKPFMGAQHTYYSRAKSKDDYDSIRGIFRTGVSLSTKFYKIVDIETDFWGADIERMRHIVTPSVLYEYTAPPTIASSVFDSFDGIDSQTNKHSINLSLENKFQLKRNGKTVEFLRAIIATDFRLKEDPARVGFDQITTDVDFRPTDWLTMYFDSSYDTRTDKLDTANFDMYINGGDRWALGIGKRFNNAVDDQLTAEFRYKINSKWAFRMLERYDLESGTQKEQEYVLTRDLHAWEMDFHYNETRGEGSEILLLFRLKAFPDMGFDFGTSFNKRKSGSQSSTTL